MQYFICIIMRDLKEKLTSSQSNLAKTASNPFLLAVGDGDLDPHLIECFLGLLESPHQTGRRSV